MAISAKYFISGMAIGIVLLGSFLVSLPDGKLHITFCNVGQGDATYIRLPSGQDALIDGGPDNSVLTCLGKHMPFYDRTIDLVILSHPQKDHMQGLISVLERYSVKHFIIGVEASDTKEYKTLKELVTVKKIAFKNMFAGDNVRLGGAIFSVLWPDKEWAQEKTGGGKCTGGMSGCLAHADGSVLGITTDNDVNQFSYYINLEYGDFSALFTGDGDSTIQPEVEREGIVSSVNVLKVPHHGSKIALLPEFLEKIKPRLAVISVGKNSYGHPAKVTLDQLNEKGIAVKRTDREGDIEVVSNGNTWTD